MCAAVQWTKVWVFATNSDFLIALIATVYRRALPFQVIISVESSNLILKYERFNPSGGKDIGIR